MAGRSRWAAALTVVVMLLLLTAVPGRVRLLPAWTLYAISGLVLVPMLGIAMGRSGKNWLRAEHAAMVLLFTVSAPSMLLALGLLVRAIIGGPATIDGLTLLVSSAALWATNVLIFSLVYWHVDRGGPTSRSGQPTARPDWAFPQYGLPAELVPPNWQPAFVDYLFLALSTATAFSTTEVTPVTGRAKRLMTIEIAISLVTIVVVGARAVNVLGS